MTLEGKIQTRSGRIVDVLNPRPEDFDLSDIAHALAHQCRFSGHTSRFYSVAEHSLFVCAIVDEKHAREALLHDAAEAYIVDVPRPIKRLAGLLEYRRIEERIEAAIAARFGLSWPWAPEIKVADDLLLAAEVRALMPWRAAPEIWGDLANASTPAIQAYPPTRARELFLTCAAELRLA